MMLRVDDLAGEDAEGVEHRAVALEGEDGVADGGIVGQAEVLLRRTRGRSRMAVPVGQNLQPALTGIAQSGKLVARRKGEMLRAVVNILHRIVFGDESIGNGGGRTAQEVAARLVGRLGASLRHKLFNDILRNGHHWSMFFEFADGLLEQEATVRMAAMTSSAVIIVL